MIKKTTLQFLKKINENNNREWFNSNKDLYENARANIEDFIMYLIVNVAKFDESVSGLEPKDCLFRIYRDTRFSKEKIPYKTNFGIILKNKNNMQNGCVYYLHIEPGSSAAYCGAHNPDPQFLYRMRKNIENKFDEFLKIINAPGFKKFYSEIDADKLKNVPRGFNRESPSAEFLKFKEYIVGSGFSDSEVVSEKFGEAVVEKFKAAKKFNDFLAS